MDDQGCTIRETAELLGVSEATVRRRIKAGELSAEKRPGPFGDQWFIAEKALEEAAATLTAAVVYEDKPITQAAVREAVLEALESRDKALQERLDRIEETLQVQEDRRREWEERRDRQVTEALEAVRDRLSQEELPVRRDGWLSRLLRLVGGG
jgi:excisionase family DNA binding protein